MAAAQIDFWFTMGSTYSFLSVMRLAELERSTGIAFRWRPFHLLVILQEMKHVPFADKPTKLAYMWRDVVRRAAMYGIPVQLPAPYPAKQSVAANLVATVGMREGWGADLRARHIGAGFSLGKRPAVNPTSPRACVILARSRHVYLHWPILKMPRWRSLRRPMQRGSWEFLVHRHSPWIGSFSGATTGWRMQLDGDNPTASSAFERVDLEARRSHLLSVIR